MEKSEQENNEKIESLSNEEFSELNYKEVQNGNNFVFYKKNKKIFGAGINHFRCCGMSELHNPMFYCSNKTKIMKRLAKYFIKANCSSLVICNFQKDYQKDNIDFFRSIGFKDITTYENKNTRNNLVSLYYKNK